MLSLVIGGSGSGKSEYAESLVIQKNAAENIYIATMEAYDEESRKRIDRHRKMRADKNFQTVECPRDLEKLHLPENAIVLLECVSNLVANEMFTPDGQVLENVADKIMVAIKKIHKETAHLIVVTNNVFEDDMQYDESVLSYIKNIAQVNKQTGAMADEVIEVVCGIPIQIK